MFLSLKNLIAGFILFTSIHASATAIIHKTIAIPKSEQTVTLKVTIDNQDSNYRFTVWEYKNLPDTDIYTYSVVDEIKGQADQTEIYQLGTSADLIDKLFGIEVLSHGQHKVKLEFYIDNKKIGNFRSEDSEDISVTMKYLKFVTETD